MKVVIVLRRPTNGYSIELVYQKICDQLKIIGISASIYKINSKSFFPLRDIINLSKINADIFHISGDVNYLATFLPTKKVILTIHDVGRYFELSGFKRAIFKLYWIIFPLLFSNLIFTSSKITQSRVQSFLSLTRNKVLHVPICTGLNIEPKINIKNNKKFTILHVGTTKNKNLTNVILALQGIDCALRIVGNILPNDYELLKKHKIDFQNYINISDQEIIELYQEADLTTFPSFHEGFGLPIIESQLAGTPVITSNISPMIEVAGNAAHLIDPHSVKEISQAVTSIIKDYNYRAAIIKDGFRNSERYSAKIVAEEHLKIYKQLLE